MDAVLFVKLEITGGDEFLFTQPSEQIAHEAIPSLESVSVGPAVLDPGRSIGQRETVTARFSDHLYQFAAESFDAGTFWTKFRAIYENIQGSTLRVYRGEFGDELADMEARSYVIDSLQVTRNGATIAAKDPLTLVLGRASQAPNVSTGELGSAIDEDDTAVTLTPGGIGNLEYPASGKACIGGSEIVSFTRSADAVTLTSRGDNLGGVGEAHDDGSKFQLVLEYSAATPSEIVYDLLTTYTDVDPAWITLPDWETAVDEHIGHTYSAQIAAPESVTKLLDELSEQVGMTLYWDSIAEQLRLITLAPTGSAYAVSADNVVADTFNVVEQPDKRISQPWVYYAQRDPVKKIDEEANYRRVTVGIADNEADFTQSAIKKVFSRWISLSNQVAATRLSDMLLARYKIPPRQFTFELFRSGADLPKLGSGVTVSHWLLVDANGAPVSVAAQIISEAAADDRAAYKAEEVNYDGSADTTKFVIIDSIITNVDLRELFDSLYSSVGATDVVTFIVQTGASINGYIDLGYAVTVGSWPGGVTLNLIVNGRIYGSSEASSWPGHFGPGFGITTARAINIENNGEITVDYNGIVVNGWSFVTYSGSGSLIGQTVG